MPKYVKEVEAVSEKNRLSYEFLYDLSSWDTLIWVCYWLAIFRSGGYFVQSYSFNSKYDKLKIVQIKFNHYREIHSFSFECVLGRNSEVFMNFL